jgi:hypothetical protein
MPSNFSSLRSSRDALLQKLAEQAKQQDQKAGQDDRFWKMTIDQKTKLGSAIIRFLPAPQNDVLAWVRLFRHAFKAGGGWFIDNCPTTIGRQCPVCAQNNELWDSGDESNKGLARDRKRKLQYISNVLVIADPAKPENNGKVFLFSYGQKIFDKIKDKLEPEFASDAALNPFDLWEGADFKLRSRDQGGFVNYDKSEFANPAPLFGGDEAKLEALWLSEHALTEFVDEKKAFKSYEDLEKRLNEKLSGKNTGRGAKTAEDAIKAEQGYRKIEQPTQADAAEVAQALASDEDAPAEPTKPTTRARTRKPTEKPADKPKVETAPAADDDDEIRSFFAELDE